MTPIRQRMFEGMQIRNLSANTQKSYPALCIKPSEGHNRLGLVVWQRNSGLFGGGIPVGRRNGDRQTQGI